MSVDPEREPADPRQQIADLESRLASLAAENARLRQALATEVDSRPDTGALLNRTIERQILFTEALLSAVPTPVFFKDADRRYLGCNEAFTETTGMTAEGLRGQIAAELWPVEHRPREQERDRELLRTAAHQVYESKVLSRTGEERDVVVAKDVFYDESGQVVGLVGAFVDITERHRAEDAARERSAEADRFFSLGLDLLCIADTDGYFRRLNPQWQQTLGYEPAELVGKRFLDFVHPDDAAATIEAMQALVGQREVLNFVNRYRCRDGSYRWIEWRSSPAGTLIYAAARDITERVQAEEERRRIEAQARQAQKLESLVILAGGVAHDFNNLLTAISGQIELARRRLPGDSHAHRHLEQAQDVVRRAADLARQMLAYSGKGRSVPTALDLSALVEEAAQEVVPGAAPRIQLRFELRRGLPPLEADASQLRQVVASLVTNALEALGDAAGEVRVATCVTQRTTDDLRNPWLTKPLASGTYLLLEVTDTGCGMDEATVARLFDPFFSTKFPGRGLSLAAVLGIVRGHRGSIQVRSEVGRGSTFTVFLPASTRIPARSEASPQRDASSSSEGSPQRNALSSGEGVQQGG